MSDDDRSNGYSQSERETSILTTPPGQMTNSEKRVFAWRRWYGIGPEGREIDEWAQKRIASHLGVSTRSVRRWVKEEPAPIFDDLTRRERMFIFGAIVTGNGDLVEAYLHLLDLETRLR